VEKQMSSSTRSDLIRVRYIFALVISFFIFELYLFLRSFPAEYNIFLRYQTRIQTNDPFWTSFWFGSELTGEVGLILRFVGVCSLVVFSWILVWRGQAIYSYLKRAVLLEGVYYLFMIPFILSLYLRPDTTFVNIEAGLSYTLQILFISPAFLMLYLNLKKAPIDKAQMFKWGAIAVVGYTFALWIKHFLLMIYALPINLANSILVVGSLNATLTILVAGLILTVTFLPIIRKRRLSFNSRLAGVGFLLIGVHFVVYVVVSLLVQRYWDFMMLTELWALAFIILSIGYISKR
jgi:hypothetical protein